MGMRMGMGWVDLGFGDCLAVDCEWAEGFASCSACTRTRTCFICTGPIICDIIRMGGCPCVFDIVRERFIEDEGVQYSHRTSALAVEPESVLLVFFVP